MTLPEWTAKITEEAQAAGFQVTEYEGFPLIATPESFDDKYRFLKFKFSMSTDKRIYSEGILIVPAGSPL